MVKQENLLGDQKKVTPSVWLYVPVPKCEFPSNPRLENLIDLSQILPVTSSLTMSTIMPEGVWLAEVSPPPPRLLPFGDCGPAPR